ncbi:MAG: hypothetical protein IIU36_01890 [Firmicutes bacterium]|nr:hypothetical protein [Bacillota bacterium]
MAFKKRQYDDDDGRVIADMGDLEPQPLFVPRFDHLHKKDRKDIGQREETTSRPEYDVQYTSEERRAILGGTMAAVFLVGGIFIVAFGLFVFVLTRL